jgi:hypothetical protein
MRRLLANITIAFSLLFAVMIAAEAVRSFWRWDLFGIRDGNPRAMVGSYRARLVWFWQLDLSSKQEGSLALDGDHEFGPIDEARSTWDSIQSSALWRFAGFSYTIDRIGFIQDPPMHILVTPSWFLIVITAAPGALRLRSIIRRRTRLSRGLCAKCGYDLRASVERCPECGASISGPEMTTNA